MLDTAARHAHHQAEVAARMGVTQGRISAIEHARAGATELRTLAAYVEALGANEPRLSAVSTATTQEEGTPWRRPHPRGPRSVTQAAHRAAGLATDDIVEAMMHVEVAWMRALAQGGALVGEVLARWAARKASDD